MPSPMERAELFVKEGRLDDLERLRAHLIEVNNDSVSMYERNREVIDFADEHLPEANEVGTEQKPPEKKNSKKPKKKTKKK